MLIIEIYFIGLVFWGLVFCLFIFLDSKYDLKLGINKPEIKEFILAMIFWPLFMIILVRQDIVKFLTNKHKNNQQNGEK